ncbi:MAG TPA: hypothetical protein VMV83_04785 [Rectinemataceae bacterium]|nr:hypothetical protein [Rectinemataceae bacterium]
MKSRLFAFFAVAAIFALIGATTLAAQEEGESGGSTFGKSDGPAGLKWTGGNMGSSLMNPGLNCISCHTAGEGPHFTAAGTVYAQLHEKNLDLGVKGATVVITDANGKVVKLETNKSGNFFSRATFAFPIHAEIVYNGKTHKMYGAKSSANCAICHTEKGLAGAPGRVTIP